MSHLLTDEEKEEVIDLTKDLVRIPSMENSGSAIYKKVFDFLKEQGSERVEKGEKSPYLYDDERFNIIARVGSGEGPKIMMNCHLDTVDKTEGCFHPPFSAAEEDGRIYGLGAADMKGGCASAIMSFIALSRRMKDMPGELMLTCVFGEESPFSLGSDALLKQFDLTGYDLIISTEPSPLLAINDHCLVHKKIHRSKFPTAIVGAEGRVIFEIDFYGRSSHASHPSQGINALHDAAKLITEVTRFDLYQNIKMGRGHYVVLNIDGGNQSFTIPSRCRVVINRQLTLGETDASVIKEIKQIIKSLKLRSKVKVSKRHKPSPELEYRPYLFESSEYLDRFLGSVPLSTYGKGRKRCLFTTSSVGDFNLFGTRTRVPTVIFGPGGGNIHSPNEFVNISEILLTTEYLLNFFLEVFDR
ncbi:MAG: M20/M25/M40 family metallo-hydrolase [Thermoplasmatota archaeon]